MDIREKNIYIYMDIYNMYIRYAYYIESIDVV